LATTRGKYKSKNYEELLGYLKTVPGQHLTVNDIFQALKGRGSSIGASTIYRQIERMVEEGIVEKYVIEANMPACFEYVEPSSHEDKMSCYHCKCEVCGKLIHLHCDEIKELQTHLYNNHHFRINPMRTVLYGTCEDCLGDSASFIPSKLI